MAELLGTFEQAVLLAIVHVGADAYGRNILHQAQNSLDRDISAGAVYTTLDRLERRGLIRSRLAEGTPARGGRARRYYALTAEGVRARADLWYLRQTASFVPRCACEPGCVRRSLLLFSVFTLMCGCWLAGMEWLLRHSGYLSRLAMDVSIALIALATMLVRLLHLGIRIERWLWTAAIALIGIGCPGICPKRTFSAF